MVMCRHRAHSVPALVAPLTHKCLISSSLRRSVAKDGQLLCLHEIKYRRRAHAVSSIASDHARYIDEVAVSTRPERLETLMKVLVAQGQTLVSPGDRQGLHPLLIPLALQPPSEQSPAAAHNGNGTSSGERLTCILRWPDPTSRRGLPVVRMARGAPYVDLLARSADEYIHRALCEEDAAEGPGSVAEAAGDAGRGIYEAGAYRGSGLPSTDTYLTRKAGMFPDVVERLALQHLGKGDQLSALITAEWYVRKNHFPGWARPFEFNATLYSSIERHEEARDGARVALRFHWWTLSQGFQRCAELARLPGDAASVQRALDAQSSVGKAGLPPGMAASRTPDQVAMDDADFLLNRVAAGEGDWDSVRVPLAQKYAEAGLRCVADFVLAGQKA